MGHGLGRRRVKMKLWILGGLEGGGAEGWREEGLDYRDSWNFNVNEQKNLTDFRRFFANFVNSNFT